MLAVSAEAKTSAGAPWVICCTSADEASKLKVTLASGLAAVKAAPISLNASVSDAAANTVMSPVTAGVSSWWRVVAAAVVAAAAVVVAEPLVAVAAAGSGDDAEEGDERRTVGGASVKVASWAGDRSQILTDLDLRS